MSYHKRTPKPRVPRDGAAILEKYPELREQGLTEKGAEDLVNVLAWEAKRLVMAWLSTKGAQSR